MKKSLSILLALALALSTLAATPVLSDKSNINPMDQFLMVPYNDNLSKASTILTGVALVAPGVLALDKDADLVTLGVMYAETMATTWIGKELVKGSVYKGRPYLYFEGAPEEKEEDWYDSFPSGHTSMAFASAAFASTVFAAQNPDSKWKTPVTIASYSLAATVAGLRIASGSHFLTDTLAGAVWGTACGLVIPKLHMNSDRMALGLYPYGLLVDIKF